MSYDLFLLAHPDDELFVYPFLMDISDQPAVIAYLTNGSGEGLASHKVRQKEAERSIAAAGHHDIAWIGIEHSIQADHLGASIAKAYQALLNLTDQRGPPRRIITHAWEGGHPDHDAAHLLGRTLARRFNIEERSLAFPYYRAPSSGPWPFRVMAPLKVNGDILSRRLSLKEGLSAFRGILFHPSQTVSFIGLSPGMFTTLILRRQIFCQLLSASSAPSRPLAGKVLYERRSAVQFDNHVSEVLVGLQGISEVH